MNYLYIKDNKIVAKGNLENISEGVINIEVDDNIFNNSEKYIYSEGNIIPDPDYDKKQEIKAKKARIEEIKEELGEIDLKSIRAIRAQEADIISKYEQQALNLREEMGRLNAEL